MSVEIPLQVCVDDVTSQTKSTHPGRSPRGWVALYYRTGRTSRTSRTSRTAQRTPALTDLPRPPIPQERDRGCTPPGCPLHSHGSRGVAPMTRGSADANDNDPLWVAEQASPSCRSHKGCTACRPARDPDRGHFCIARWSRHEVPKTPGLLRYAIIYTTPTGCRSLGRSSITSDPWRGRGDKEGLCFPGVVGATPLRHPGYEKRTPPGCPLTGRAMLSDGSDGAEDTCSLLENPPTSADLDGAGLHPLRVPAP